MKCEKFIEKYLQEENDYVFNIRMVSHYILCRSCRKFVGDYQRELMLLRDNYPYKMNKDISKSVMLTLVLQSQNSMKQERYLKWIIAGLLILSSRFAVTYSDSHIWLNKYFGDSLGIPLNIVMGITITIYATLFIISHLDDLKKRMNFKS